VSRAIVNLATRRAAVAAAIVGSMLASSAAFGQSLGYAPSSGAQRSIFQQVIRDSDLDAKQGTALPAHLRRQVIAYQGREVPGAVIIDTPNTRLLYVIGQGRAISYGIGVGREGFTWSGVQSIVRKAEWPDWIPPTEMLQRQPYLPRLMAGGPGNPLGARALYLGGTIYRIHGTNAPETIGMRVSSGCIRMLNEDVIDLYGRVNVGTKVVVLPDIGRSPSPSVASRSVAPRSMLVGQARASSLY
jgi:lipoprotein-anchoring transpeptidase ErfK/SrfK